MKQDVKVKSYVRKGKLVKNYQRKQDSALVKATIVAASTLGLTAASYIALKRRYIGNLDKAAKSIKVNPDIGKVVNKKDITFVLGGFTKDSTIKNTDPLGQARYIRAELLTPFERKLHEVIALDHKFTTDNIKDDLVNVADRSKLIATPLFKGRNDEAVRLAEEIYSWHIKNPNKPINLIGFSIGGNLGRDVEYILRKKKVNVKLATLGTADLKLVPSDKHLNIMGSKDEFNFKLKSRNSVLVNDVKHTPDSYIKNDDVQRQLKQYLFN